MWKERCEWGPNVVNNSVQYPNLVNYCNLGKMTQCKVSGTIENKNDVYRQLSDMLYIRKPEETSIDFLLEDVKPSINCTKPVKLEFFHILSKKRKYQTIRICVKIKIEA